MIDVRRTNDVTGAAGRCLSAILEGEKGRSFLLMLSGGSAFGMLAHVSPEALTQNATVTVLDERFSTDEAVNNFAQLAKTGFYAKAKDAGAAFIDTRVQEGRTLDEEAAFLNYKLGSWKDANPDGIVVATLGIGVDAHTAGIMPFPEGEAEFRELFDGERLVVGYDAGQRNAYPLRITVTNRFLRDDVSRAIVFAAGEVKRPALESALADGPMHEAPARVFREMRDVTIFTDIDAVL